MVLCCICGVEIKGPSQGARCANCLKSEVDITQGVSRHHHVQHCSTCGRWLKPGGSTQQWVTAELETRDLLGVCLKHVKGISKERSLVDAGFIYTEPHSKELKVKLVLQSEVASGVVVQQTMVVEYRIDNLQCNACKKTFTKHFWESNVQVRQRNGNRRTLMNLEQLILKHKAHTNLIKVQPTKEGMDFFFTRERDAQAFVSFVKSWTVVRHQESKHLVSADIHNSTYRFKRTTAIELCPVCKEDLVLLPPKIAKDLGGLPPLMICTRAVSVVGLLDPSSGRSIEVSAVEYWKKPFQNASTANHMTEFVVLDVTPLDHGGGGFGGANSRGAKQRGGATSRVSLCEIELARVSDFGRNEERITVRSHLGHLLHVSDIALGYDIRTLNIMGLEEEELQQVPLEVYLVKKKKPEKPMYKKGGKKNNKRPGIGATERRAAREAAEAARAAERAAEDEDEKKEGTSAPGEPPDEAPAELQTVEEGEDEEGEDEDADEDDVELRAAAAQMLDNLSLEESKPQSAEGEGAEADTEAAGEAQDGSAAAVADAASAIAAATDAAAPAAAQEAGSKTGAPKSGKGGRQAGKGGGGGGYSAEDHRNEGSGSSDDGDHGKLGMGRRGPRSDAEHKPRRSAAARRAKKR